MRLAVAVFVLLAPWVQASSSWIAPEAGSSDEERLRFWSGYSLFRSPWVAAPSSTTGRDGLGPYFNARSCDACHTHGAGGTVGQTPAQAVVRVGDFEQPEVQTAYGEQLQVFAAVTVHAAEAQVDVQWQRQWIQRGRHSFEVALPQLTLVDGGSNRVIENLPFSLRLAPPLFGLGQLESVGNDVVLAREDPDDRDADGVSGRASWVTDEHSPQRRLGRFGHKAERFSLQGQIAAALREDIGITSPAYPTENCAPSQADCLNAPSGANTAEGVEITAQKLALLADFVRHLQAPPSSAEADVGAQVFGAIGCSTCHVPDLLPGPANQQPFTDLLLHDLGPGLADNRQLANAAPGEWRTSPLWGLGRRLTQTPVSLLHDGRASSLDAAVHWHAGEAALTRDAYFALDAPSRQSLIEFLQSL